MCCYMFREGIDHRDIKADNILFNPFTRRIKLIDFGSACPLVMYGTDISFRGTSTYLPPEYLLNNEYHPYSIATWAIGCIAYDLLNGDRQFNTKEDVEEYKELNWKVDPSLLDQEAVHFVTSCLEANPVRRIKLHDLIFHPWVINCSHPHFHLTN